jgi:hypothetical protein
VRSTRSRGTAAKSRNRIKARSPSMKHFVVTLALLFMLPLSVRAGTTGCLSGTVTDDSGMPIANALVTATSPSQVATTRTDARGWFAFISLAPGSYAIASEKDGYDKSAFAGVVVSADHRAVVVVHQTHALIRWSACVDCGGLWSAGVLKIGEVADTYTYPSALLDLADLSSRDSWLLRLTPGVTSGPGSVIPH